MLNLSRNPYYVKTPSNYNLSYVEFRLFFSLDTTTMPANPNFVFSKTVVGNDTFCVFEFSDLIHDQILNTKQFAGYSKQGLFVNYSYIGYSENDNVLFTQDQLTTPLLFSNGYDRYEAGINPTFNGIVSMSNDTLRVQQGEQYSISLTNLEGASTVAVNYKNANGDVVLAQSFNGTGSAEDVHQYSTYNLSIEPRDFKADVESTANAFWIGSPIYDEYYNCLVNTDNIATKIEISQGGVVVKTIEVENINEQKYPVYKINFVNRYGALQNIFCFGKNNKSLKVNRKQFKRNLYNRFTNNYNPNLHQYQTFDIQGRERITLNTGFVNEQTNQVFEELLASQYIWIENGGETQTALIKDTSINYKTHLNEKLINYTFNFEIANDLINKVY